MLDRLGAKPAATIARRRLLGIGVTRVPRGPQERTLGDPGGLASSDSLTCSTWSRLA